VSFRLLSAPLCALVLLGAAAGQEARAADKGQVFPVKAFFYDAAEDSNLDPAFKAQMTTLGNAALADKVHGALSAALQDRVGTLDSQTVGRTFATSMHVTRATSFVVDKGNGNSDVLTSVTAALYFTNVRNGEILMTVSRSVVVPAVVANADLKNGGARGPLFARAVDTLIRDLAAEAGQRFSPVLVETRVGYAKGLQTGDDLNGPGGQLIRVVYTGEQYAVAEAVLADAAGSGAVFQRFLAHAASGKRRPRTAVLVESRPERFGKDYIAQMFSELVGDKAPLSLVQINTGFSRLLNTVTQQSSLSITDTARRSTPELFLRLRVAEPMIYEAATNLAYVKLRHYETYAFADLVDTSGRVLFSAMGKDVIEDRITRGVGAGMAERREVSVKNALTDLAGKLVAIGDEKREQSPVVEGGSSAALIDLGGKVLSPRQEGVVLRKARVSLGGLVPQQIWVPVAKANLGALQEGGKAQISVGLGFDAQDEKIQPGQVFETSRVGTPPRSAATYAFCGAPESLGDLRTPALMEFSSFAVNQLMPGMSYVPTLPAEAARVINQTTGFAGEVPWKLPQVAYCLQPVDRVSQAAEQCDEHCERAMGGRYTLRIKAGAEVLGRPAMEAQFRSSGYYPGNEASQLKAMLELDVARQSQKVLGKLAEAVSFPR
jgi:hypothetical protein